MVQAVQNSNSFYRDFSIPKRLGGTRQISVPSPFLLHAQRWINDEILSKLEVHTAAHGFIKGRSIVTNARVHLGKPELLKMDLSDFFPTIHLRRVIKVFLKAGYPVGVSFFLASLCCRGKRLPQGAATSPSLSNIIAKSMDIEVTKYAEEAGLTYTRYADDLVLSGENIGRPELDRITWLIQEAGFVVNKKKTRILRGSTQKIITGISISSGKLALPRNTVREIKLEAYHILKRGYFDHARATNNFDPILMERLLGRVGFWLQVDPLNATAQSIKSRLTSYVTQFDQ
ncbi:reverse transcriptase family protein [Pseudorhodobacter sp. W20_MBD10_FR17]|uniref:reverse transcriptase family protein n=1 Tax=Pseudorhodobacter sp. W20_MBD10_FR17 TaxID=3240266 RepID=UPI003F98A5B5